MRCPYKGLAAFERDDAEYFFGREGLVAELVAHLVGASLLAVVGPSGSGKSSVVQGRAAAHARRRRPAWKPELEPGRAPPGEAPRASCDAPCAGSRRIAAACSCVDQFEELFTACRTSDERADVPLICCCAPSRS